MKASELRYKTADELRALLIDFKKEQFNLRFRKVQGDLPSPLRIREVRRTIARIKTLQSMSGQSMSGAALSAGTTIKDKSKG